MDKLDKEDIAWIKGWLLGVLFAWGVGLIMSVVQPVQPNLIGIGCEGSNGPLLAAEEDHFPKCVRIEAY